MTIPGGTARMPRPSDSHAAVSNPRQAPATLEVIERSTQTRPLCRPMGVPKGDPTGHPATWTDVKQTPLRLLVTTGPRPVGSTDVTDRVLLRSRSPVARPGGRAND